MNLLPFRAFNTFSTPTVATCPVCLTPAAVNPVSYGYPCLETVYCRGQHPEGEPSIDATTLDGPTQPHLHRTCPFCEYEWMEETAQGKTNQ